MPATNCPSQQELIDYALGRRSPEVLELVSGHVEQCPQCQTALATVAEAEDTLVAELRRRAVRNAYAEEPECQDFVLRAEKMVGELGRLGEYELLAKLGKGGMGAVYKARQVRLDMIVALKVLPRDRSGDPLAATRFEREIKAVGRLSHPNIVQAHDARDIDGTTVLVMEYVEGCNLSQLGRRVGPLAIADACEIVRQVALGLQCAHEHGLVHRDIKPSNLMLSLSSPSGRGTGGEGLRAQCLVKILDLGLALLNNESAAGKGEMTSTGQAMGTADYMAPEQAFDSHKVDIRADIYALGCTLYKLLTGNPPFTGSEYDTPMKKMLAHVQTPPAAVRSLRPEIPAELAAALERMMAKDPADRFATPVEVAEALPPFAANCDLRGLCERAARIGDTAGDQPLLGATPLVPTATAGAVSRPRTTDGKRARLFRVRSLAVAAGLITALACVGAGMVVFRNWRPRADQHPAVANQKSAEPDALPTDQPLRGRLDVLVWHPKDRTRQGLRLRDPGTLPLQAGDQVRVAVELNRPAYVYLVWIDTAGVAAPVYPWKPGRWVPRPETETPVERLELPDERDRGWPMGGGPGMETLVLVARDTPLPASFDFAATFSGLKPQTMQNVRALVEFDAGQVITEARQLDRGPKFFNPQQINDVVLQTQQRIAEKLGSQFSLIRAVSFANGGE